MEFESSVEIDQRAEAAEELYSTLFDEDERPYFVSDRATLYDIFSGDEAEAKKRLRDHYGVSVEEEHFRLPVWNLLDYLAGKRPAQS